MSEYCMCGDFEKAVEKGAIEKYEFPDKSVSYTIGEEGWYIHYCPFCGGRLLK